jgi:hypothetical protein
MMAVFVLCEDFRLGLKIFYPVTPVCNKLFPCNLLRIAATQKFVPDVRCKRSGMERLDSVSVCSVYLAEIVFNHGAHHTRRIKIVVMYMYLKFAKVASKTFFLLIRNRQNAECRAWF